MIALKRLLPILAAFLLAGCAARDGLKGHPPSGTGYVGDIVLPEVRPGEPDQPFRFRARPGGLLYVYFGYTNCPDVCPTTLADLRTALKRLGPDGARVEMAFVTVDPYRDTTEALVPYVRTFVPAGHAIYPRGQAQLGQAETAFGATSTAVRHPEGDVEVSHSALGYAVDETGHVRVQWDFGVSPDVLTHDLRLLLSQKPGTPA